MRLPVANETTKHRNKEVSLSGRVIGACLQARFRELSLPLPAAFRSPQNKERNEKNFRRMIPKVFHPRARLYVKLRTRRERNENKKIDRFERKHIEA